MSDNQEIKQISSIGAKGVQIGIQNNNFGLSPQEASELTINLFMENFPKLQEEARKVATERVETFVKETIQKLLDDGISDFTSLKDPDTQYILLDAQSKYARFGTDEMLDTLTTLISKRIQFDKDFKLKVTIDKAIEIAPMLTSEQLDLLSLYLICIHLIYQNINDIRTFQKVFEAHANTYQNADFKSFSYLNMLGCFELNIKNITDVYSKRLGVTEQDIINACPELIKRTIGDYTLSNVGKVLGCLNAETKSDIHLDLHFIVN